jgi:cytochrome c peroxidase
VNKPWLWLTLALSAFYPWGELVRSSAPQPRAEELHRSPVDVVILADGRRVLTANHTADSVSLVDLGAGKVLAEQACGRKPAAVACSRDGRRAAASNLWSGSVTLLEIDDVHLRRLADVPVGHMPRGLAFAPNGRTLYVALSGAHEVVQLDWQTRQIVRRWPAPTEPYRLALTSDGRHLAVACARSAEVRCWDTQTGKQLWERRIIGAFNLHGLTFSPDGTELIATHCHDREHPIATSNIEQGWAIDNRLTRLTREPDPRSAYSQIALDVRSQAVGDPCAAAFSARGDWLAVTAGGTHELLLLHSAAVPWGSGAGDFFEGSFDAGDGKFHRIALGGRPVAVQFVANTDQAVVANYLLDALQVVDARTGKLVRRIPLGGPARPALAREGEAIFYDAQRSHHQWFSCHSCHPDGHTNGRNFDTLNDDSYGNSKLTPTLRGVTHTGPWTWHGWQKDLGEAIEKSLTDTLFGPKPSAHDVKAVVAYLETLEHPPNPHRRPDGSLSPAAERGKALFHDHGRCVRCHQGDYYTSTKNYDVKLEPDGSPFDLWNPPSLRGIMDRGPYLHDGRATTLEELLRAEHSPEKVGSAPLTPEQRQDLIEFLKSL